MGCVNTTIRMAIITSTMVIASKNVAADTGCEIHHGQPLPQLGECLYRGPASVPLILVHGDRSEDDDLINPWPYAGWSTFLSYMDAHPDQFLGYSIYTWYHDTSLPIGFNYASGTNAAQLGDTIINDILPQHDDSRVLLVAHSRGGLVCRSFMMHNDNERLVHGLITLSTPHHGSPLAVPDWFALYLHTIEPDVPASIDNFTFIFDHIMGHGGAAFDIDRPGEMNLAWDNEDGKIGNGSPFPFDASISASGMMQLTVSDTNSIQVAPADLTVQYLPSWKTNFGTMDDINSTPPRAVLSRIIAYGVYDDTLAMEQLPALVVELASASPLDLLRWFSFRTWADDALDFLTLAMAGMSDVTGHGLGNYYANDGMVPLQSALFLTLDDVTRFSSYDPDTLEVAIDAPAIHGHSQCYDIKWFTNGIENHQDALNADINTYSYYWANIASDLQLLLTTSLAISHAGSWVCEAGDSCEITGQVLQNGAAVSGATIEVQRNGETVGSGTSTGGQFSVAITAPNNVGQYLLDIEAEYAGRVDRLSGILVVLPRASERVTLSHLPSKPDVGDTVTVAATVRDDQGNPVSAGQTVEFWTDPSFASSWLPSSTTVTNSSGVAQVTWIPAQTGTATLHGRHIEQDQTSGPHSVQVFEPFGNYPTLRNPNVSPSSGTDLTNFTFSVDYYDEDGDVPLLGRANVFIDGHPYNMTLVNGTASDGRYAYTTSLGLGWHYHYFQFVNPNSMATTAPINGPFVGASGNAVIEPLIHCEHYGCDLELKWSLNGLSGPWTPIATSAYRADTFEVPVGSQVTFLAGVSSPNYDYVGYSVSDGGSGPHDTWTVYLGATITEATVDVTYTHTPQLYTISGTVADEQGSTVSGGVNLTLSSPFQTITQYSTDGTFSFSGISGGVDVDILAEAPGYVFRPSYLTYPCLDQNHTDGVLTGSTADVYAPTTILTVTPSQLSDSDTVTFEWTGEDDVSSPGALVYEYMVEGADGGWNGPTSNTTVSYDLPNGVYAFLIRATDEVGNVNQAPLRYPFAVSAAPRIASAVRTNVSVWASRILLSMPADASVQSNEVIIIPEHSGTTDPDLVPIALHWPNDPNIIGVNEIVAAKWGEPTSFERREIGWSVTLPGSMSAGDIAEFDIVWGRIAYLGWQEEVIVPEGFPDGGQIYSALLADDGSLWRVATREDDHNTFDSCDDDAWITADRWSGDTLTPEHKVLRFTRGECWTGDFGVHSKYWSPKPALVTLDHEIGVFAGELRTTWNGTNEQAKRPIHHMFQANGIQLAAGEGPFIIDGVSPAVPRTSIHGSLWTLTSRSVTVGPSVRQAIGWFMVVDPRGSETIPSTPFDVFEHKNARLELIGAYPLGAHVLILWIREWETSIGEVRMQLQYSVVDVDGSIIVAVTPLSPPVHADGDESTDEIQHETTLFDKQGQVWVSYTRYTGLPYRWYYSIVGADGAIAAGPVETQSLRKFRYADPEGLVWATESGQLLVLSAGDTLALPPRDESIVPSQDFDYAAAYVASNGSSYRVYDRWSPVVIQVDVPEQVQPHTLVVTDLDLWNLGLSTANPTIELDGNPSWQYSGLFTDLANIDVSGLLDSGEHSLVLTQSDFEGGQLLVSFPYEFPAELDHLEIQGPDQVDDTTTAAYSCVAHYSDGRSETVSPTWSTSCIDAAIDSTGTLTTPDVVSDEACQVVAEYTSGGITKQLAFNVAILNRYPDCDGNGIADNYDVDPNDPDGDGYFSEDCNGNGIPDVCDLDPNDPDGDGAYFPDCNENDVPDTCDITACVSDPACIDCNNNGVPDGCEFALTDCNENAVSDECEIAAGLVADCNLNGMPDECDVASGASVDCNGNGIPDECDIVSGTSDDCNKNGIPDDCDLDPNDPDGNGDYETDCNGDGKIDSCETVERGDFDNDGDVDAHDLDALADCMNGPDNPPAHECRSLCRAVFDFDTDGDVDVVDLRALQGVEVFTLTWSSIDNGGGVSEGDGFTLFGTVGQPDSGEIEMAADGFTLVGGF